MESEKLIEGDFMYVQHMHYITEDFIISSDESEYSKHECIDLDSSSNDENHPSENESKIECQKEKSCENDKKVLPTVIVKDVIAIDQYNSQTDLHVEQSTSSDSELEDESIISKNDSQIKIKKERLCLKSLILRYCSNCKQVKNKKDSRGQTKCETCRSWLKRQCARCKILFKSYQLAYMHMKNKCRLLDQRNVFSCSSCYFESYDKQSLNSHIQNKHVVVECPDCNFRCQKNLMLKHHVFNCKPNALNTSSNKSQVRQVDDNHTNFEKADTQNLKRRIYKYDLDLFLELCCSKCNITISKPKRKLPKKCSICKLPLKFQCVTCCKQYKLIISAYNHIRCCNLPAEFRCADCNYQTKTKMNLAIHIRNKHSVRECKQCHIKCNDKESLKRHKKFECPSTFQFQESTASLVIYCPNCKLLTENQPFGDNKVCIKCSRNLWLQCTKCETLFLNLHRAQKHTKRSCDAEYSNYQKMVKMHSMMNSNKSDSKVRLKLINDKSSDSTCPDCGKSFLHFYNIKRHRQRSCPVTNNRKLVANLTETT